MSALGGWRALAPSARRAAARERLEETRGYERAQRISALRRYLRDPVRARRAREDRPEGDDRLLYLRVQSALRRFEQEEREASAREESARARRALHAAPARTAHAAGVLENAASQIAAVLRPRLPDHQTCS